MKLSFYALLTALTLLSCAVDNDCPEGINKLPMYGNVKKCKEQLYTDSVFLADCDKSIPDRKQASKHYSMRGWQYLYQHKTDTAMMRFNQAWLLDKKNTETYWGFADLTGMAGKFTESVSLFKLALAIEPANPRLLKDASNSYCQLYLTTHNKSVLDTAIQYLKTSAKLEANPATYADLTAAYIYYAQKDSAKKYLMIADKLDPNAVNPEVRRILAKP